VNAALANRQRWTDSPNRSALAGFIIVAFSRRLELSAVDTMRQRTLLLPVLPFLFGILMLIAEASRARNLDPPRSFYIVTEFFSDYLADSYEEILDVTPQGKNVRVRVAQIVRTGARLITIVRSVIGHSLSNGIGEAQCTEGWPLHEEPLPNPVGKAVEFAPRSSTNPVLPWRLR